MSRYYMTPFESMIGHTTLKTVNKFCQIEQGNPRKSLANLLSKITGHFAKQRFDQNSI